MDTCYIIRSGQILVANEGIPCTDDTGVRQCCGRNHICGAQGFCHFTNQAVGNTSGYYLGGCTDSSFSDPACPQHCRTRAFQDVVYNTTDDLWACCVSGDRPNCINPSDETFAAPAPADLFTSSTSTSSTATSTSTATPTNTTDVGTTSTPATGVPTSTIAIAIAIPAVAIITLIGVFLWWRRKKNATRANSRVWADKYAELMYEPYTHSDKAKDVASRGSELSHEHQIVEMPAENSVSELDGRFLEQEPFRERH